MTYSMIGYHTRLYKDHTKKVCGGSFHGALGKETIERLANTFSVTVLPSGRPVFVDREGREVSLYVSVDASEMPKGKVALKAWHDAREKAEAAREERAQAEAEELEQLMPTLTHADIVRRLSGAYVGPEP